VLDAPFTNSTGDTVGVGVALGSQDGVAATPGDAPFLDVAGEVLPAPPAPPGRVPLPAGEPPPLPPEGPDGCPVSMVELTCTIACRNGGTASAILAMNATPASTAAGRSQARPGLRAGAAWRAGTFLEPDCCNGPNRGNGRELSLGRASGQVQ
jgi:hypothetical protein